MGDRLQYQICSSTVLTCQLWWLALHNTINASYHVKAVQAFPLTWTRLNPDPKLGGEGLVRELGANGYMAVAFIDDNPVACGGLLPYRGPQNPVGNEQDTAVVVNGEPGERWREPRQGVQQFEEWEICCFCVHPQYRGQSLSPMLLEVMKKWTIEHGGKKMLVNYVVEEIPTFWIKSGFVQIEGAMQTIEKGFKVDEDKEALANEIHIATAQMTL